MEREVVYHTNNPNFATFAPPIVQAPQLIGPPIEDVLKKKEEDQRLQRKQLDPLPRFNGGSAGTMKALKYDLDMVLNNELKRTILQAANPYLEFTDLLLAAGSSAYTRSEFIYDVDFFDNDEKTFRPGDPKTPYDISLRGRRNITHPPEEELRIEGLDKFKDSEFTDDPDEFLSKADREALMKNVSTVNSIYAQFARIATSRPGRWIRNLFRSTISSQMQDFMYIGAGDDDEGNDDPKKWVWTREMFHQSMDPVVDDVSDWMNNVAYAGSVWVADMFTSVLNYLKRNKLFKVIYDSASNLMNYAGSNIVAPAYKYVRDIIFGPAKQEFTKVVANLTESVASHFIQGKYGNSPMSTFIGNNVTSFLQQSKGGTSTTYYPIIEEYVDRFLMAAYNEVLSQVTRKPVPTEACIPPDMREFQKNLFAVIIDEASSKANVPNNWSSASSPFQQTFAPVGLNIFSVTLNKEMEDKKKKTVPSQDPFLDKIYNNMESNLKKRKHHEQEKFYLNLLPTVTLFNALDDLRSNEQAKSFWKIHPIREFLYLMKSRYEDNLKFITDSLIDKIKDRLQYNELYVDGFVDPTTRAKGSSKEFSEADTQNVQLLPKNKYNYLMYKMKNAITEAESKKEAKAALLTQVKNKVKSAKANVTKADVELLAYLETETEKAIQAVSKLEQEKMNLNMELDRAIDVRNQLIDQVKETKTKIEKEVQAYTEKYSKIFADHVRDTGKSGWFTGWFAVKKDDDVVIKGIETTIGKIITEIQAFKNTYLEHHIQTYLKRYAKEYDNLRPGSSQDNKDVYIQKKLEADESYKVYQAKLDQFFKILVGVAQLQNEVNGIGTSFIDSTDMEALETNDFNTYTFNSTINHKRNDDGTIEIKIKSEPTSAAVIKLDGASVAASLAKLEMYIGVGHLLQYMKNEIQFAYVDTDDVSNPFYDQINDHLGSLFDNLSIKFEDTIDLQRLKAKEERRKEIEADLTSWKQLKDTGKYFIYDTHADVRYNTFMMFNTEVTPLELNFHAVLFKERIKGCIQMAADEINLCTRQGQVPFEVEQLIVSPYVSANFAKFVMFIYEGRSRTNPSSTIRGLAPYATNNMQIQARPPHRTRFHMTEDGQFMEGVINFFRDVQYNRTTGLLEFRTNSAQQALPDWQVARLYGTTAPPTQNFNVAVPVLRPYLITSDSKRQRIDFRY